MPPPTLSGELVMVIGAEPLHREHGAGDVDNRVERADLVEMNLLDRHLMNRRFGFAETLKETLRASLRGW